jgi:hypothetical protein
MSRTYLFALILAAACGGSSSPSPDAASAVDPTGNWAVTLTFTTGTCTGLPATYVIGFTISGSPFTFTPGNGLSGDSFSDSSSASCTTAECVISFTDTGPGTEFTNVTSQTTTATLDQDPSNNVTDDEGATAVNQIDFVLSGSDGSDAGSCTEQFTAAGNVTGG